MGTFEFFNRLDGYGILVLEEKDMQKTHRTSEAKRRANAKYDATHTRQVVLKLNLSTDSDILEKLDQVSNRQGYIKELIRNDISNTI